MAEAVAARQTAQWQRADPQRRAARPARPGAMPARAGIDHLQRALGNRGMYQLLRSGAIQAKLAVGPADDEYEREADRVADTVMRMSDPTASIRQSAAMKIQRICPESEAELRRQPAFISGQGVNAISRKCGPCEEDLRRAVSGGVVHAGDVDGETESGINALRGGGQPLSNSARSFFEPRFDSDLGHVRIHTGASAVLTARSVQARAFTLGNDIVFAAGQYSPDTKSGRALIAHELAHTFQQSPDPRRVRRFVECLPVTMQLGPDEERCPKRAAGEIGRSRSTPMFVWDMTNPSGWLIESFAIGHSDIKPNLPSNQRWSAFLQYMTNAADTHWEILGFSDCRGSETTNKSLRKARAQSVFDELPASVQLRIDTVEAAPLHDCIVSNTAEIGRAMNRSAFIRITALSIEGDTVTGKRPKPKPRPTARTVDCHQSEQNEIAVAYPIAIDMVDKALEVMASDTTERKDLLEKWCNDSSVSTVWRVRAGFQRLRRGITTSFKFECEHKGEWFYDHFCDSAYAYVRGYVGFRVHLCEHMFGRPAPEMAKTIVHECSHMFDFTDDEEYCPSSGCPKSLDRWDAIDNADSYAWFAYDAYHL
ncbi:MAG: DUF4157 domain-containing protein [Pseudomonadota bacterium]|nr:DUF4157 domain-containing protein [Pseudomonadota bacterium]